MLTHSFIYVFFNTYIFGEVMTKKDKSNEEENISETEIGEEIFGEQH